MPTDGAAIAARVVELYERVGMSTRRISETLGLGRREVDRLLRAAGVLVAPRGAGRARPTARHADPTDLAEQLYELYVRQRLTRRQVSEKLGISEGVVRHRLAEFGIPTRTRGGCNREDRREIAEGTVTRLYWHEGLGADAAAERLGVSRGVLLRSAHEHGIAVRPGAAAPQDADAIELVAVLYADPLVNATLRRHHLPAVPPGGPIWQRFPTPPPLTRELCGELYLGCGLSAAHIELLTGHPKSTVFDALRRAGIARRPPGGRSPFLRRWEQNHRARDHVARRPPSPP